MKKIKLQICLICLSFGITSTQNFSVLPKCPTGFIETETICYTLSKKGKFLPKCPSEDVLSFDSYKDLILQKDIGPLWIPFIQNDNSSQWINNTVFSENVSIYDNKKCLLFHNNSYTFATQCDDQYPRICAYSKQNLCGNEDFCNVSKTTSLRTTKEVEFVAILLLEYDQEMRDLANTIQTLLLKIDRIKTLYTPRINKILSIEEAKGQILVNVHLTPLYINHSNTEEQEFDLLKTSLISFVQNVSHLHLIDFLSSVFCPPLYDQLNWPETEVGKSTEPEEFCFLPNGSRPVRFCLGSLIDGAHWASSDDNLKCTMATYSSVSLQLVNLLNNATRLVDVENITTQYQKLKSFDVYLVSQFFEKFQKSDGTNRTKIFEILDDLLFVDKMVLQQSEVEMRAIENILKVTNRLLLDQTNSIISTNFVVLSLPSTDFTGFIFHKNDNSFSVNFVSPEITLDQILTESFDCIFWLSPPLRDQLIVYGKLTVLFYSKDSFFTETLTPIFSFQVSENSTAFDVPLTIIYNVTNNNSPKSSCAFWSSTNGRSSWVKHEAINNNKSVYKCEFWSPGSFAMIASSESNVTYDLSDILQNNYSVPETMLKLMDTTKHFQNFESKDVFLLSQILEKVGDSQEIDLEIFAQVISNSLKIKKTVLQDSQVKMMATDLILYNIDKIVENLQNQSELIVVKENFAIFWTNFSTNFTGLIVLSNAKNFEIEIVEGDVDMSEIIFWENFTSAVIITSELKKQLDSSDIIISVFFNNNFFNQTTSSDSVQIIFGVILPEIDQYASPVSIYHKKFDTDMPKCVYWSYNPPQNISGSWFEDSYGTYTLSTIQCNFWHTTHLGLLLLQEDKYKDKIGLMEWMNIVEASLSCFGFLGILLTSVLFRKWRRNKGNQILLNFSLSIMIHLILFYVSGQMSIPSKGYTLCVTLGAFLHYSILAQFSWMFVLGILQFKRFVIVFGSIPKYLLLKACLFGWGLPLIFVSSVLIFDQKSYLNAGINFCYPSGLSLALAVWLPIGITVVFNICVFIFILYSVCYKKLECGDVGSNELLHQWRLALLLFFLLGITWSCGLLANLQSGIAFLYIFNFTVNLQGFVLFLYFIVFNANTRHLYVEAFKRCSCRRR